MAEKREVSKDYYSTKPIVGEWFYLTRYDKLYSGVEGQGAELINVGPGPESNPTRLLCDHSEETTHRIRVVWVEPIPGDIPYPDGVYKAWDNLGITDRVLREAWIDKTPLKPVNTIPVNIDKVVIELLVDWENRTIVPKVVG